jgi:hypothetical protein
MRRFTNGKARVVMRLSRSLELTFRPVPEKPGCSAGMSSSSLAVGPLMLELTAEHQPATIASPSEKL